MKCTTEIIDYLARPDTPNTVYLAPNAPPITRSLHGLNVALSLVPDAGDIYETLVTLRELASVREGADLPICGRFSFAVPGRGRFRVQHATQRGTKVATVSFIPYDIPALDTICPDPLIQTLASRLMSLRSGILVIAGPDPDCNGKLLYSMLREINQRERLIVYVLERTLSYVISHGESVVIQAELGPDIETLDGGLVNAYHFRPHLIALGDLRPNDDLPNLKHAVGAGLMVILTSVSVPGKVLLNQYAPELSARAADSIWESVSVLPLELGRIAVRSDA